MIAGIWSGGEGVADDGFGIFIVLVMALIFFLGYMAHDCGPRPPRGGGGGGGDDPVPPVSPPPDPTGHTLFIDDALDREWQRLLEQERTSHAGA